MAAQRTTCLIEFDNNPQKVFYGGQLLSGRVTLTLHKPKNVRGISIEISGRANCRWTEGSGDSRKTHIGEEIYLAERTYFLGDKTGEIELQPGTYNYAFRCQLPAGLPTSVEATHGHIRYSAIVNLDRPMWVDQEFEEGFTVIKPLNLNAEPHLACPQTVERRKTFSLCCLLCCCCQSDPLFITARLPVSGFTPGDVIPLEIEANNRSDLDVESFRLRVEKRVTFRASANSSREKVDAVTVIERTAAHGCKRDSSELLVVELEVPSVPPTDTTTSTICRVEYCIVIHGVVLCCHSDPELKLPITIGTVPFSNRAANNSQSPQQPTPLAPYPTGAQPPHPSNTVITTAPSPMQMPMPMQMTMPMPMPMPNQMPMPMPTPSSVPSTNNTTTTNNAHTPSAPPYDPMSQYADCDPPTYEQAISGQVDIQGKIFAPFYPVFRRNQSITPDRAVTTAVVAQLETDATLPATRATTVNEAPREPPNN